MLYILVLYTLPVSVVSISPKEKHLKLDKKQKIN